MVCVDRQIEHWVLSTKLDKDVLNGKRTLNVPEGWYKLANLLIFSHLKALKSRGKSGDPKKVTQVGTNALHSRAKPQFSHVRMLR